MIAACSKYRHSWWLVTATAAGRLLIFSHNICSCSLFGSSAFKPHSTALETNAFPSEEPDLSCRVPRGRCASSTRSVVGAIPYPCFSCRSPASPLTRSPPFVPSHQVGKRSTEKASHENHQGSRTYAIWRPCQSSCRLFSFELTWTEVPVMILHPEASLGPGFEPKLRKGLQAVAQESLGGTVSAERTLQGELQRRRCTTLIMALARKRPLQHSQSG